MRFRLLTIVAALLALCPIPSFAYIDPGTGSMLLQSALAAVAVALVFGRALWHKIKSFFGRSGERDQASDRDPGPP